MEKVIKNDNITSGSNYLKLPDGTLIQWGIVNINLTNPGGQGFPYSGGATVTFGIPFLTGTTPIVISDPRENGGYWNSGVIQITRTTCEVILGGDNNQATKAASWLAIGRWK